MVILLTLDNGYFAVMYYVIFYCVVYYVYCYYIILMYYVLIQCICLFLALRYDCSLDDIVANRFHNEIVVQ